MGYQAEGTLGRRVQEGAKEVLINDRKVRMQLRVEQYRLSGHADRTQLETLPSKIKGLKRIFIIHGEPGKSEDLRATFSTKYEAIVPRIGGRYTI